MWAVHHHDDIHVVPVNDLIEHELRGEDCVCGPSWERANGINMYVHNSLDGREAKEPK